MLRERNASNSSWNLEWDACLEKGHACRCSSNTNTNAKKIQIQIQIQIQGCFTALPCVCICISLCSCICFLYLYLYLYIICICRVQQTRVEWEADKGALPCKQLCSSHLQTLPPHSTMSYKCFFQKKLYVRFLPLFTRRAETAFHT